MLRPQQQPQMAAGLTRSQAPHMPPSSQGLQRQRVVVLLLLLPGGMQPAGTAVQDCLCVLAGSLMVAMQVM